MLEHAHIGVAVSAKTETKDETGLVTHRSLRSRCVRLSGSVSSSMLHPSNRQQSTLCVWQGGAQLRYSTQQFWRSATLDARSWEHCCAALPRPRLARSTGLRALCLQWRHAFSCCLSEVLYPADCPVMPCALLGLLGDRLPSVPAHDCRNWHS